MNRDHDSGARNIAGLNPARPGMPGDAALMTLKGHPWLWMIPLLLLAVFLAGRRLNSLTFTKDETWTLIYVGARNPGPYTIAQALESELDISGDQPFGWTILINRWGAVAGWSTVAMRAWSLLFGVLALAMLWRAGRDMFGDAVGLAACLLLMSSSLFMQYFHVARAFTAVVFFTSLTLWSYWRIALNQHLATRTGVAGLLPGGIGLLYSHYFAALLLPALGLFHLLFVRKDRRWWVTSLLFVLISLAATPELTALRIGVEHNVSQYGAGGPPLQLAEVLERLLYTMSNGVFHWPRSLNAVLLALIPIAVLALYRTRSRGSVQLRRSWFLGFTALFFFLLVVGVNHFVPVLFPSRMRYLLALWPPLTLIVAVAIHHLGRSRQRLADSLLAGIVASGIVLIFATPYYRQHDYHEESIIHLADQALQQLAGPDDFLLLHEEVLPSEPLNSDFYLKVWEYPREVISGETDPEQVVQSARNHSRVWLLAKEQGNVTERELAAAMRFCQRPVRRGDLVLTLYARSEADCD
ncbi:MAG: glycosyltransferase family 39 protein [Anaerolineaceae bacterium]|nr:glycosyltransferase family 39 protein [Anaerolineaceae bacterium]